MFKSGQLYKHSNCLDVFIWVSKVQYRDAKRVKLKANWCIQGTASWWLASNVVSLEIDSSQFANWKLYNPPNNHLGY